METSKQHRQPTLKELIHRIRESSDKSEILDLAVTAVQRYLSTDRVKIYQFQPDGHGVVVAEFRATEILPSLLGIHFPADNIPMYVRDLYDPNYHCTVADVSAQQIAMVPLLGAAESADTQADLAQSYEISNYRPSDWCYLEYLRSMGVWSSLMLPIIISKSVTQPPNVASSDVASSTVQKRLWGALVSHHSTPKPVTSKELNSLQAIVSQLTSAVNYVSLLEQFRVQTQQKNEVHKIFDLLHSTEPVNLQAALEGTVGLLKGTGGRLYLPDTQQDTSPERPVSNTAASPVIPGLSELYVCGHQPSRLPPDEVRQIEEHLLWQKYLLCTAVAQQSEDVQSPVFNQALDQTLASRSSKSYTFFPETSVIPWTQATRRAEKAPIQTAVSASPWAVPDIYREPLLCSLVPAFQSTGIQSLLIVPIQSAKKVVGCLTIFRKAVAEEINGSGQWDMDKHQASPRQSFEAWKERSDRPVQQWCQDDINLAQALAERFATAVKQHRLHKRINDLNHQLKQESTARTEQLEKTTQMAKQQHALAIILEQSQKSTDISNIFRIASQEVQQLLAVERVAIYRFHEDGSEALIPSYGSVDPSWQHLTFSSHAVFNDSYLQEIKEGKYFNHQVSAVEDVETAGLSNDHLELLNNRKIRAYLICPLFIGKQPWGLFTAYQHSDSRPWLDTEISFVSQVTAHLSAALQQTDLLTLAQQKAQQLPVMIEQQQMLASVIGRIRESLDLNRIFTTTTREVRQLLMADRVSILQFEPGYNAGYFIAEDVNQEFFSTLTHRVEDHCFGEKYAFSYQSGQYQAISDIHNAGLSTCHIDTLSQFQIQANLVIPLCQKERLWGLLCIHQCAKPRQWKAWEIEFVQQIATHLSVALQQAKLLQDANTARQEADTANHAKSKFLETMSHELRTPLNAILGLSEGLRTSIFGELCSTQNETIATIENSGKHLLALITDILDLSKIESGKLILQPAPTKFDILCKGCIRFIQPLAINKQIELIANIQTSSPPVCIDELRLRQLLINLLNNAVKFTPEKGTVTLNAEVQPDSQTINIQVIDTGIGISQSDQARIFGSFVQIDSSLNRRHEGTGLGLALVKRLVEAHQGQIDIESTPGEGSCFQITLPYLPYPSAEYFDPLSHALPESELIEASQREEKPDKHLSISDENTHLVNSLLVSSASKDIQISSPPQKDIAAPQPKQRPLCNSKNLQRLKNSSDEVLVLLAEDNSSNVETFLAYLNYQNYTTIVAEDGQKAIDLANTHKPDIILMDIQMPNVDGISAIRAIRKSSAVPKVPIIALTALAMPGDQDKCLEAGADCYLSKPVSLITLGNSINRLLSLSTP